MKKAARRREARGVQAAHPAQRATAGGGPERPTDVAMVAWLLAPESIETLRRELIDGKAGDIEPQLWKLAYTEPFEPQRAARSIRYMSLEQVLRGEANKPGPPYLNAPPGLEWGLNGKPGEDPIARIQGRHHLQEGTRTKWDQVAVDVRRAARALLEDPAYREALGRRVADGNARTMRRLLWQWAERKSREPADRQPQKPLTFVTEVLPWLNDPLAAREGIMLEAQDADEALQARAQEQEDKQAAAAADAPSDEPPGLEFYQEP